MVSAVIRNFTIKGLTLKLNSIHYIIAQRLNHSVSTCKKKTSDITFILLSKHESLREMSYLKMTTIAAQNTIIKTNFMVDSTDTEKKFDKYLEVAVKHCHHQQVLKTKTNK